MKVAYILHRFPHLSETFIVREMLELQKLGVSVEVFSLMEPKSPAASPTAEALVRRSYNVSVLSLSVLVAQLRVFFLAPRKYVSAAASLIWLTWREPRVMALAMALFPKSIYYAEVMRRNGVDHIQANFVWLEALSADVIRQVTGITYTIRPHAFGLFGRNRRDVRLQLERADGVITISQYHRRFIQKLSPKLSRSEIDVIHCGLDTSEWRPSNIHPTQTEFRILSVGRPVPKKGHAFLIDACAELARRGRDFKCDIVVGEGRLVEELRDRVFRLRIEGFISLLPSMDEESLQKAFREYDAFALACVVAPNGDRDGIPVVLMEAMSSGLPVVTTDVAGIPELVRDGETGLLVPQANAPALADALERMIDEPTLREKLGAAGRVHVIEAFSIHECSKDMAEALKRFARLAEN